jgi:tetratricopeptide (TPR) repeat protein
VLLEAAAVAVDATASDVLAECVGQPEWEAVADLELACAAGLLKEGEADDGRVTYRCAHDLLREAVVSDLRPGRRALLHKGLGEALEHRLEGCGSRRDALIPRIAYHFASTAEHEKAALYLRQAGDQARKTYAHQEATRSYRGVAAHLDALGRERDAADVRQDLAAELAHRGRYAEALAALERAEAAYRALGEIESRAAVVATMASIHATRGTGRAGLARLRSFVEALTGSDASAAAVSPMKSAELLGTLSHLDFMAGHYEEALRSGERAVETARATGNELLLAQARVALGVALLTLGRLAESGDELEWAIAAAEAAGDDPDSLSLVTEARLMAIWTTMTRGNFARSGELVEQALKVAQRLNNLVALGHALFFHALLAYYTGDWAEARRVGGLAAGTLGEPDSTQIGSYPPLGLGWLSLVEGRREEALPLLEEAGKIARRSEGEQVLRLIEALLAEDELVAGRADAAYGRLVPLLTAESLQARTRVELSILRAWGALQMGKLAEAEEMALTCVRDAREHDMRLFLPDALRVRALCAVQRGARREAKEAIEEALRECRKMPYPYAEAKALYAYGELCLAMGEPGLARERFREALAICNQLGERMYGAAIERALVSAAGL